MRPPRAGLRAGAGGTELAWGCGRSVSAVLGAGLSVRQ